MILTNLSNGDSITLPKPDFDNAERIIATRVVVRTRGGDLYVFREPYWPINQVFAFRWNSLLESQRQALILFYRRNLGRILRLTDHENRLYDGIIQNPGAEFVQSGRFMHVASLDFETIANYPPGK